MTYKIISHLISRNSGNIHEHQEGYNPVYNYHIPKEFTGKGVTLS